MLGQPYRYPSSLCHWIRAGAGLVLLGPTCRVSVALKRRSHLPFPRGMANRGGVPGRESCVNLRAPQAQLTHGAARHRRFPRPQRPHPRRCRAGPSPSRPVPISRRPLLPSTIAAVLSRGGGSRGRGPIIRRAREAAAVTDAAGPGHTLTSWTPGRSRRRTLVSYGSVKPSFAAFIVVNDRIVVCVCVWPSNFTCLLLGACLFLVLEW